MGKSSCLWGALALIALGCKIDTDNTDDSTPGSGGKIDTGKIKDQVNDAVDNARDLEICPGQTVDELLKADSLSDECRDALLSFLPKPQSTFDARLLAPGGVRVVDGELRVLVQAADADGKAVSAVDLMAGLEVSLGVGGEETVLARDAYSFVGEVRLPTDLLSIAVVNDYSASMLDGDLDDVEEVETALFGCMPALHETEVIRFSEQSEKVLEFTSDRDAIAGALARDDSFERGTTALLDAVGGALDDLSGRDRPVRVVILATDGRENASTMFDKPEVLAALEDPSVFIVVLGALLADVDMMKELAATSGVYFYTREFSSLADSVQPYCDSLAELTELRIPLPADGDPPDTLHLVQAGVELKLDLQLN